MQTVLLNNGVEMPILGYGVFQVSPDECERCVTNAIEVGYRLIDTAQAYMNEEGVGRAWRKSGIDRKEFFLVTKVWVSNAGEERAYASILDSLRKLDTDYIDLLLIHQPYGDYYGTWRAMERALAEGKVRAIGVSNFSVAQYLDLVLNAEARPAVNQVETNVFSQQLELAEVMEPYGTKIMAWGPLNEGNEGIFTNELLANIGDSKGKTVAQVALRYLIDRGIVAIPKSDKKHRMEENFNIFDFQLTDAHRDALAELNRHDTGTVRFSSPEFIRFITKYRLS
ncbi:MAG: aldo/keto reductase [Alloprevotella sp.]|nr:aldo/keto reductase [Bacteroidales bacterium]MDY3943022.1 aldo/keto reductase [Alloprevotella sp.]